MAQADPEMLGRIVGGPRWVTAPWHHVPARLVRFGGDDALRVVSLLLVGEVCRQPKAWLIVLDAGEGLRKVTTLLQGRCVHCGCWLPAYLLWDREGPAWVGGLLGLGDQFLGEGVGFMLTALGSLSLLGAELSLVFRIAGSQATSCTHFSAWTAGFHSQSTIQQADRLHLYPALGAWVIVGPQDCISKQYPAPPFWPGLLVPFSEHNPTGRWAISLSCSGCLGHCWSSGLHFQATSCTPFSARTASFHSQSTI